MVGKLIPLFTKNFEWGLPHRERGLYIFAITRILFVVFFVMCVHMTDVQLEAFAIVMVALFGLTNGFLGVTFMMIGPNKVSGPAKEVAGTAMVYLLSPSYLLSYLLNAI